MNLPSEISSQSWIHDWVKTMIFVIFLSMAADTKIMLYIITNNSIQRDYNVSEQETPLFMRVIYDILYYRLASNIKYYRNDCLSCGVSLVKTTGTFF